MTLVLQFPWAVLPRHLPSPGFSAYVSFSEDEGDKVRLILSVNVHFFSQPIIFLT